MQSALQTSCPEYLKSTPSTIRTLIGGTTVPVGRLDFFDFSPRPLDFRSVFARASGGATAFDTWSFGLTGDTAGDAGAASTWFASPLGGETAFVGWRNIVGRVVIGDTGVLGDDGCEGVLAGAASPDACF
jgi:hypothetical protein